MTSQKLFELMHQHKMTLVTDKRFINACETVKNVDNQNIQGAIVECGVYKGGCFAGMAKFRKDKRDIWGFDSFEGLPAANPSIDCKSFAKRVGDLKATEAHVLQSLAYADVLVDESIHIIKGFFDDSLPLYCEKIGQISILRLDGDLYQSTMTCLDVLYDNVVVGGYIIIDDYGHFEGCRKAVDEFRKKRKIDTIMIKTDATERVWIKER